MHNESLIAGNWIGGEAAFASSHSDGAGETYSCGTPDFVAKACVAAEDAFWSYAYTPRESRATFLEAIAE